MEAFPAFFPLAGRRVVVAGEGEQADAKLRLFEGSPARVDHLTGAAAADPASYAGAALAFVASSDLAFRKTAAAAVRAAHVPLNVVDDSAACDFHTPAVIDRGQVVAAVGTAGASPILSSLLRAEVEARIPEGAGRVAALLGLHQAQIREAFPDLADRRAFLRGALAGPAAEAAMAGDMNAASSLLLESLDRGSARTGRVTVVLGAEAPDLISLRAVQALAEADAMYATGSGEAVVRRHGRRDAAQLSDAAAVLGEAAAGRHVAVVAEAADSALLDDLSRAGVPVVVLRPAPAP
jgi:precorrin-2 dehydrogenase/sirohydrochlorin ferrochelatase